MHYALCTAFCRFSLPFSPFSAMVPKVYAYITYREYLLVFRHPFVPEAGIQVPGGSVEPGEDLDEAVLREAVEETGLTTLQRVAFLGDQIWHNPRHPQPEGSYPVAHRHFYHLTVTDQPPETWRHSEPSPSIGTEKHVFEFFWVPLSAIPPLITDMGYHLPALLARFPA
jgi:8-oxo-dGTP diphosphatase